MFEHILAGHDGSVVSDRAFRVAVALASAFHGRVRLVGVVEIPPVDALALALDDERSVVEASLRRLVASLQQPACPVDVEVACGAPPSVLLEQARVHAVDHIVLGRTGKGAIGQLLVGSVSREVTRRACVGITLVP